MSRVIAYPAPSTPASSASTRSSNVSDTPTSILGEPDHV